jgi:hypothetical protein
MAGITLKEQHKRAEMRREISMMRLDEARISHALKLFEDLPEFAEDTDEKDWVVTSGNEKKVYTEQQIVDHLKDARVLARQPAGRNILQTMRDFIIGKRAEITADPANEEVQAYWDAWAEDNDFDMKSKEIINRTIRDGESFLRWFPAVGTDAHLQLRFIDPTQITAGTSGKPTYGIETAPDDYEEVISYNRKYTDASGILRGQTIPADEIDHVKIGVDSDVKRGTPFFEGIGKYMRSYDKWIEDRIKLNRIRHIWNIVAEPLSGAQPISDLKAKFADVTAGATATGKDAKKQATRSGSVLFSKGIKWDLKALNIRANDTKEDGRLIQLMIALGTNIPEYVVRADASNANYSSTMVAESPFVRAMEAWQDFFEKVFKNIYRRVIEYGIERGDLKSQYEQISFLWDAEKEQDIEHKETVDTPTECSVNFATLIHRDIKQETDAVQIHVTEGWCSNKTASETFGYNWDTEQEQIARERKKAQQEQQKQQELFAGPDGDDGVPGGDDNPDENED